MRIVDLHCDTLTECEKQGLTLYSDHTQLGFGRVGKDGWCQAAAVFMPDHLRGAAAVEYFDRVYDFWLHQLELWKDSLVQIDPLEQDCTSNACPSVFLTVEGGSVLAGDLSRIKLLAQRGVRMLTLTWNGANELGGGQAEDTGLTPIGRQAIPLLEQHNIIVDVSHLGDTGFWQVAQLAKRPFAASHSNSRAVCPHPRNLTDDQFRAIVKSGGIVGLNFCEYFISDLGPTQPVECLLAHINHFVSLGGADHIALGSDFDGAPLPVWLDRSEKLDSAIALMIKSGLEPALAEKICYQNARAFFARYRQSAVGEET